MVTVVAALGILVTLLLFALIGVIDQGLKKLTAQAERIAKAFERESDPIAKMHAALKEIKATADAEVARRKAAEASSTTRPVFRRTKDGTVQ